MKHKRSQLGELVRKVPLLGSTFYQSVVSLKNGYNSLKNKYKIRSRKKRVIRSVLDVVEVNSSLNVSVIGNFYVFHNRKNSLIKYGDAFELEVQYALKVLANLKILKDNKIVFADIGVNIGLHSIFILNNFPSAEIIAFDPSPNSYKYLELTINFNKIKNVRFEKVALGEKNEERDFLTWGENSSGDSLENTHRGFEDTDPKVIKVKSCTLDSIIDLPPVNIMKIDTEGSELEILKGSMNTIRKNKPFIVLEFHKLNRKAFNVETKHIFEFLDLIDYSIFSINFNPMDFELFNFHQENFISENFILLPNSFTDSLK